MAPNPFKPLIAGMFVMLAVAAATLFAHFIRLAEIEQRERREAFNRNAAAENERRWKERQKATEEKAQAAAKISAARAQERAALEAAYAKRQPFDVGTAFGKLRRRAETGDPDAQTLMGYIHLHGMDHVLRVDPQTFGTSGSPKHASALIGQDIQPLFFNTRFEAIPRIPEDRATGLMWYDRAARQGHRDAQASLATAYTYGPTTAAGQTNGYMWSLLANQQAWPEGYQSRDGVTATSRQRCHDILERKLTDDQKAAARKAAAAFRPYKEQPAR